MQLSSCRCHGCNVHIWSIKHDIFLKHFKIEGLSNFGSGKFLGWSFRNRCRNANPRICRFRSAVLTTPGLLAAKRLAASPWVIFGNATSVMIKSEISNVNIDATITRTEIISWEQDCFQYWYLPVQYHIMAAGWYHPQSFPPASREGHCDCWKLCYVLLCSCWSSYEFPLPLSSLSTNPYIPSCSSGTSARISNMGIQLSPRKRRVMILSLLEHA